MSWSLGEIRALSIKAARGAGLDWGIAEEVGFAVEWLETHGLDGVKALAQYLSRVHRKDNYSDDHCPIKLGCLASDMDDWTILQDKSIHEPILILPFIANILKEETLELTWADSSVQINPNGIKTQDVNGLISRPSTPHFSLKIKTLDAPCSVLETKSRVSDNAASYVAILNALAHKTYAPATEASRLAGAGAGLNDND